MSEHTAKCKDCKWWFKEGLDTYNTKMPEGQCYRMPNTEPKRSEDWCGEFEKEEE